ncbi:MAG: riboflavin synthase [Nitrospirae bacterium]|nr:riboflavin synthase [Nitrospirota bacterium]
MFTGLIIELGEVVSLKKRPDSARLSVRGREIVEDAALGDSIAINGICLTVINIERDVLSFDVSYETLKSTNLGSLKAGDRVNLEPSLKPSSKMGGHFVTGHVDGVGRIRSKTPAGNAVRIDIETPGNVLKYLVEKGSGAIDGKRLTGVEVMRDAFSVVIIPHTAKMTTIGIKNTGDTVNLEPDILAKYVAKFLQIEDRDASLLSALKQSGFIS